MPRRFPIVQFPNGPLMVAMASRVAAERLGDEPGRGAKNLSSVALLVWGLQELSDGANWFRRLIGLGGVAYGAASLVNQ